MGVKCDKCGKVTKRNVNYFPVFGYPYDEKDAWGYTKMTSAKKNSDKEWRYEFCPKCARKLSDKLNNDILKAAHDL